MTETAIKEVEQVEQVELNKVTPKALAVLDKYKLLDVTASVQEQTKISFEIYKDPKKVGEIYKAIFKTKDSEKLNFEELDIMELQEGIRSFFLQLNKSSS